MSNATDAPIRSRFIATMEELKALSKQRESLSVEDIFRIMGDEGHALLLIFLCLPYMQPIPIPFLSTVFGALTALVGIYYFIRRPPYLPARLKHFAVPSTVIAKVSEIFEKIWMRIGHLIHERWDFFVDRPVWRFINLFVLLTNAFLLALPLPIPMSNFFPNITILLLALGLLEKDGVLILVSYAWSLICYGFFIALSFGTVWSVSKIPWF